MDDQHCYFIDHMQFVEFSGNRIYAEHCKKKDLEKRAVHVPSDKV